MMNITIVMMNMMIRLMMMMTRGDQVTGRVDLGPEDHLPLGTAALCAHHYWDDDDVDGDGDDNDDGDDDGGGDDAEMNDKDVDVQRGPAIF